MPRGKKGVPRLRYERDDFAVERFLMENPSVFMFLKGSKELERGNYGEALRDFDMALDLHPGIPFSEHALKIFLKRAECLLLMGLFEESLMDSNRVLFGSKMIGFPEGVFFAVQLIMRALELTDNIKEAFQMALLLMCMNQKEGKVHVERLRAKLEDCCSKNANLVHEIQECLMKIGLEFYNEEKFLEAAEHFAEVIKLVCKHVFVPEAYLHHAKCLLKLGFHKEAMQSCLAVLDREPDNEEGKVLMAQIDACIQKEEEEKSRRKKTKKKAPNAMLAIKAAEPEKKPVMNKKQRKQEEDRRRREYEMELEKTKAEIADKKIKDQEKMEQQAKSKSDVDKARSLPSYDVHAANEASGLARKGTDKSSKVQAVISNTPRNNNNKRKETKASNTCNKGARTKQNSSDVCSKATKSGGVLFLDSRTRQYEAAIARNSQNEHLLSLPNTSRAGWPSLPPNPSLDESNHQSNSNPEDSAGEWTLVTSKKPASVRQIPQVKEQQYSTPSGRKQRFQTAPQQETTSKCQTRIKPSTQTEEPSQYHEARNEKDPRQRLLERSRDPFLRTSHVPSSEGATSLNNFSDYCTSVTLSETNRDSVIASKTKGGISLISQTAFNYLKQPNSQTELARNVISKEARHGIENTSSPLSSFDRDNEFQREAHAPNDDQTTPSPCQPQSSSGSLPAGVLLLCQHFLQDNKKIKGNSLPKPCVSCEKRSSNFIYGAWNKSRREWQEIRPYPKLHPKVDFRTCWHFDNGKKCLKSPCTFAHGDKELAVWTLQRKGVLRPPNEFHVDGPGSSRPNHDDSGGTRQRGTLTIHQLKESSLRPPPAVHIKGDFKLCYWWEHNLVCRHGPSCIFAHGEDELKAWMSYRQPICQDDTTSRGIREESPDTSTERNEPIPESKWVRDLPGVKVSVDPEESVILQDNKDCHTFQWTVSVTFKVQEVGQLSHIDLLHRYHHCYRIMAVKVFLNNKEQSPGKTPKERWSYKLPEISKAGLVKVEVGVSFESKIFGTFTQCLAFLFGKTTYLMQGLNVDIGSQEILSEVSKVRQELKVGSSFWTQGSMEVVPSPPKTSTVFQDDQLLKRYKLPDRLENIVPAQVVKGNVSCKTYQRAMHQLLFVEELSMKSEISRYVLHEVQLHGQQGLFEDMAGMRFATNDKLFGILRFQEGERFNPDDSAGRLLLRNVCSVWLKLSGDHGSRRVYEVPVEKVVCENVVLKLPSVVSNKLQVTDGCDVSVDAQFQLNRQPLCEQHAAIDRLGPLQMMLLFPDQKAAQVKQEVNLRWKWLLDPRLNKSQEDVIRSIATPGHNAPPLVVFGPFGTGKTFTLNQAVRHLVTNKSHRILLCTHSNRAADIHVELLHEYLTNGQGIQASKPLRIYQPMRRLDTASQTAKAYALIENNAFLLPTRKDVIDHRVVITTLATSKLLLRLQLNHGFFTHILVDEAAQALEPEALTPLALAGPNTKVVFTGDHMQISPEVYSQYARNWGLQRSLPERLFDHYTKSTNPDSMSPNVVFLTENYRCHPDILQFPSDNFYGKELVARGSQLAHPRLGPLLFFSARGKERREADSSYMNAAEVHEVVKRVKELADDWPEEWGPKVLSDIAVLSAYRAQVQAIRASLRKQDGTLKDVTVDTIHNVQGQEFRALFISTVRTAHTCQWEFGSSQRLYLEFLSDPKLLNTAVTRAKSLVAVVGDPVSLCTIGECRGNWWDFIKRCIKHQTLHGTSYDELQGERNALLAKISLNPKASPFVPKPTTGSKESPDAIQEVTTGGCSIKEKKSVETGNEEKIPSTGMDQFDPKHVNGDAQEDERETANLSQEEAQDCSSDTSDIFDGFRGEDLDDEVVFPRYLDTIIQALVKNGKETMKGDANRPEASDNTDFPTLEASKSTKTKASKKNDPSFPQQGTASMGDFMPEDYEIRFVNGRPKVHLVNLGIHQVSSVGAQRSAVPLRPQTYLDPELLQSLLHDEPEKYLACTLRLSTERSRTAYAVVSDTTTRDIKIRGRVRQAFDMDQVVIEKVDCRPATDDNVPCIQGKLMGVLEHIISPHERQYVCKADYESPGVMLPINKSVTKLVNLSESSCRGMPIYKRNPNGRAIQLDMMEFEEVLSGKYLFLVQYLQWRPDCVYPLGAVVRKIPKIETLKNSLDIVFAEHGIRREFDKKIVNEVRQKFPPNWSVPPEEVSIRRRVDKAFTIDPATSLDLDDALSLEEVSDATYRVGVHIADVSYFVQAETDLDNEALRRCTSYYPGHGDASIPMLPRELSENHCSLLPDKDRLCISLFFELSDEGEIVGNCNVERTIVRSCCKLSYPDAQKIIDGQHAHLLNISKDVQQSIQVLKCLTQRRRKMRLDKGSFDHWDGKTPDDDHLWNFEAHELVEEMMILANENIAKRLSERNPEITPLRTQLPPKDHRLNDWFKEHGKYTKFSLRLRRYFSEEDISKLAEQETEEPVFKVQESVWSEMCHAAEIRDLNRLQEFICNEANHPQLAVANSQFSRIQQKAQYLCKGDKPDERIKHFALGMNCYSHFTSPIRRYVDLEVHRLVVGLLQENQNQRLPSRKHVEKVCRRSTFAADNARKFERGCKRVHLAAQLKEKSRATTAFISVIDDKSISFEVSRQEDDHLTAQEKRIPMSNFTPTSVNDKEDGLGVLIKWTFRMYTAPTSRGPEGGLEKQTVTSMLSQEFPGKEKVIDMPGDLWQRILGAVQAEDCNDLATLIRQGEEDRQFATSIFRAPGPLRTSRFTRGQTYQHPHHGENGGSPEDVEHYYKKSLLLRKYDVAHLQLTAHMFNGILHPEIQLFKINPQLHICLEHQKYPRDCFATTSRYQASRPRYDTIDAYIDAWKPVLAMEAATGAVKENDGFVIQRLEVKWRHEGNDKKEASFILSHSYCTSRQLGFHPGDFVCLRARSDECGKKTATLGNPCFDTEDLLKQETNESRFTGEAENSCLGDESPKPSDDFWVGHYIVKDVNQLKENIDVITMDLHHSSSALPKGLLDGRNHPTTLSIIHRSLPYRRMFLALCTNLKAPSELVQSICLGTEPAEENYGAQPSASQNLSIVLQHPTCTFSPLNRYQEQAVREALRKPFTLIQGPPGTGKTVTGVHLAYWFTKQNMQRQMEKEICQKMDDPADSVPAPKAPPQVMYCGPSNKSVDVVADYMLRIPGLKIIRVYSDRIEEAEFPIPNKLKPLLQASEDESKILNEEVKAISLHHVIRGKDSPFANELRTYEEQFAIDRSMGEKTGYNQVGEYRKLISEAENWALQKSGVQVVLCTCTTAGSPRIVTSCDNIQQCIVDECGMCLEPETLVPITFSGARQVILIGDHKQLQPIIEDNVAKSLGLNVSMFERLSARAMMLEIQYRMHPSICEFPSNHFYDGKLKTAPSVPRHDPRLQSFWPAQVLERKDIPMAFCHVEGQEETSAIKTADSNEQSKANMKEVLKAVQVAKLLVNRYNVRRSDVIILSPYRQQRISISKQLGEAYKDIQVTTIAKSQGSEWDYVIISLVRSLKKDELDPEPSLQWLRKHLGFVTDEHQINVGLTRARKGLCIIGNKNLLCNDSMWQNLLEHYEQNHCVVDESWPWNT